MYDAMMTFMHDLLAMLKDGLILQLTIGMAFIYLWRLAFRVQRAANHYDWMSVIVGPDGQISQVKTQQVIAFVVVTWIIILYSSRGQLTEGMFGLYFGFTTAAVALNRYFNKDFKPDAATTVTATVPAGVTATVATVPPAQPAAPQTAPAPPAGDSVVFTDPDTGQPMPVVVVKAERTVTGE